MSMDKVTQHERVIYQKRVYYAVGYKFVGDQIPELPRTVILLNENYKKNVNYNVENCIIAEFSELESFVSNSGMVFDETWSKETATSWKIFPDPRNLSFLQWLRQTNHILCALN